MGRVWLGNGSESQKPDQKHRRGERQVPRSHQMEHSLSNEQNIEEIYSFQGGDSWTSYWT